MLEFVGNINEEMLTRGYLGAAVSPVKNYREKRKVMFDKQKSMTPDPRKTKLTKKQADSLKNLKARYDYEMEKIKNGQGKMTSVELSIWYKSEQMKIMNSKDKDVTEYQTPPQYKEYESQVETYKTGLEKTISEFIKEVYSECPAKFLLEKTNFAEYFSNKFKNKFLNDISANELSKEVDAFIKSNGLETEYKLFQAACTGTNIWNKIFSKDVLLYGGLALAGLLLLMFMIKK
jgi:hypothetical protein